MTLSHLASSRRTGHLTVWILVFGLLMGGPLWAGQGMPGHGGASPQPGKIVKKIPPGHRTLHVGSERYFYHEGIYYHQDPKGFRVVHPPKGAVVRHLPDGYETRVVAGVTYFLFAGVFYHKGASGYVVVEAPQETVYQENAASPACGQTRVVSVRLLNVRSGPGMNHPVVHQVRSGDRLEIQGTAPGWCYVRMPDGLSGWVMTQYTRSIESKAKG